MRYTLILAPGPIVGSGISRRQVHRVWVLDRSLAWTTLLTLEENAAEGWDGGLVQDRSE